MFDDWDKISNIYVRASDEGKSFLDSDIISTYINKHCKLVNLPIQVSRQLVLYSRLFVAGLTEKAELLNFIKENSLDEAIVNNIVETCLSMHITRDDYAKSTPSIDSGMRRQIFTGTTKKVQYLFSNKDIKISFVELAQKYKVSQIKTFLITLGDIILGFYKIEDTVPLLQQELELDPKTAALLGAEVIEFLTPLSDPNWQPPVEMADVDEDEDLKDITDNEVPTITPVVNHIPEKAPALALNPIHTLASDMATVRNVITPSPNVSTGSITPSTYTNVSEPTPVYQSTQPVPKPLSTIPSYTPAPTPPAPVAPPPVPDRPRWSTEI